MSRRVVVIGSSNTDLIVRTGRLPRPGETVLGAKLDRAPGGKGANQAVAAARMGAKVVFVGCIGVDAYGDAALHGLAEENIDISYVARDTVNPSGVAIVMLDKKGQNSIVVAPGSNGAFKPADIDKAPVSRGDILVLQHEIPIQSVARAIENGKKCGATIVLNPAPAAKISTTILKRVAWIIPNETEAAMLTGLSVASLDQVRAAAWALRTKGAANVIITLGRRGVWVCSGETDRRLPAYDVKVVDTTAAGDAFVGAFATRLAGGDEILEAVTWAQAAAALSVTKLGAQPSLPTLTQVAHMLKEGKARKMIQAKTGIKGT